MTLTARILLLVVLAFAPAFAVQIYNERALRAARADTIRAAALRGGQAVAADLAQFVDGARQILDILAEAPGVRARDPAACAAFLASVVGRITGANIVVVTDAAGTLECNSRGTAPGAYTLADRAYFRQAMRTGQPAFGEYLVGRGSGRPTIQVAQPLRDAAGAVVGLINLGFEPETLARRIAQIGLPREAAVTVLDRAGTVLLHLPEAEAWIGRGAPESFARDLAGAAVEGGVAEMPALAGPARITGVLRPGGALDGMSVAVGLRRDQAFADIDAANRRGIVLILFVLACALLSTLILGQVFIRRPVRRLLRTAGEWSRGDLGARSGLRGRSEFGRLGRAFDAMAGALQAEKGELKAELARSRALQEQQVTMLHELNHRVKNTLATVQSLARQSRGGEEQVVQLENRILALSKTHDLLTRRDWTRASLRLVLENELAPYRSGPEPVDLSGEDIDLPPRYVLALGMTAHELTTNAAKYGALSVEGGRVRVAWSLTRREVGLPRLRIVWQESGGPAVSPPRRRGFGSRLITGGVARELSGEVRLDFEPGGLRCTIDVPLETQRADADPAFAPPPRAPGDAAPTAH